MTGFILPVAIVGLLGAALTYRCLAAWASKRAMMGYGVARMFAALTFLGGLAAAAVTVGCAWLASWSFGTSEGVKPPLAALVGGLLVVFVTLLIERHIYDKKYATTNN